MSIEEYALPSGFGKQSKDTESSNEYNSSSQNESNDSPSYGAHVLRFLFLIVDDDHIFFGCRINNPTFARITRGITPALKQRTSRLLNQRRSESRFLGDGHLKLCV